MIRKFLYIMIILFAMSNIAFGADASSGSSTSISYTVDNDYQSDDNYFCCQKLNNNKYITQIVGYDLLNGITYCSIVPKSNDSHIPRSQNANHRSTLATYEAYRNKQTISGAISSIAQAFGVETGVGTVSEITHKDGGTLSAFLTNLAVLKNFGAENTAGVTETTYTFGINGLTKDETIETNVASTLNQSNIDYFRNLYTNMNTVYIHLQNLLFIVVGGFFLATLGGGKIQKYLENRGQSTGNKEPYLHKFFIPLLCAGVFYMPITSGGGVNSTMIQKIIQYFTAEANHIADVASNIGSQTYVRKMAESVGYKYADIDKNILSQETKLKAEFIRDTAIKELQKCTARYGENEEALFMDKEMLDWIETEAKKETSGSWFSSFFQSTTDKLLNFLSQPLKDGIQDISLEACKQLQNELSEAKKTLELVSKSSKGEKKDQVANTISSINDMIKANERDYGWLNSLIVPASALMFEAQAAYKLALEQPPEDMETMIKKREEIVAKQAGEEAMSGTILENASITIMPYITTLMLPGANSLRTMIDNAGKDKNGEVTSYALRGSIIGTACLYMVYKDFINSKKIHNSDGVDKVANSDTLKLVGEAIACGFAVKGDEATSFIVSMKAIHAIYTSLLEYLPSIITSVAAILAFLGYFVTLCKYYYISPFVVAFALTTKRVDKIVNFLVAGITIFFKPVLVVLFIYLALFLHNIIQEIFVLTSLTQFSTLPAPSGDNSISYITPMITGMIKSLLMFFGSLASCYIVWKTIMTGPDWTFKLLGLDKDTDNTIVQGLSQKMEMKATVV